MGFRPDRIYNTDESGLFWRLLPKKVLSIELKLVLLSVNWLKLGSFFCHALMPVVHKLTLENQHALGRLRKTCFFHTNQTKGWMTKIIFTDWFCFYKHFVLSVTTFLSKLKLPQKALLVLNNCPGHPSTEKFKSKDGKIFTLFLPPNLTPLLQPIDQNVIQTTKTC